MTDEDFNNLIHEMDRLLKNRDVHGMSACIQAAHQIHVKRDDFLLIKSIENAYHYRRFGEYHLSMSCARHVFKMSPNLKIDPKLITGWYSEWRKWYQPYDPVCQEIIKETEELRKKGLI